MTSDLLFSRELSVLVKNSVTEEKKVRVKVTVENVTHTGPLHHKELVIRLTDDNDLFFLYTIKLGEEDFQTLKCQQGLLVDFSAFPQKFINLLEMCLQEEKNEIPKYLLQFICPPVSGSDKDAWSLNVVETNPFKHLTHLSLRFLPGKDADVKLYLANCLKLAKKEISRLSSQLGETESSLSHRLTQTQAALSAKSKELDTLTMEWESKQQEMNALHSEKVMREKEKAFEIQNSYQQRMEREKKELEEAHLSIVKQMESKIYELENCNKELTDLKYHNDSTIRELKCRSESFEEELRRMKHEVTELRKENGILDADYHDLEKVNHQLKTSVAILEQGNHDKELMMNNIQDKLTTEIEQRKRCEEEISQKTQKIAKSEASMKAMSEELAKGNAIIKKLQGEMRNYHGKVKLRTQIATEQEKLINTKDNELNELKQDLSKTKQGLSEKVDEVERLKNSLESTIKKLEESKQLLKTNENVINWLNKQITEAQLNQQRSAAQVPSTTSTLNYRPLSSASSDTRREPFIRRSFQPPFSTKQAPIAETPSENDKINKENQNPILDAKYLQRGGIPLRDSPTNTPKLPSTVMSINVPAKSSPSAYFPEPTST